VSFFFFGYVLHIDVWNYSILLRSGGEQREVHNSDNLRVQTNIYSLALLFVLCVFHF